MNISARGPSEQEESSSEERRTNHHRWKTCFRYRTTFVGLQNSGEVPLVEQVDGGAEEGSYQDGQERKGTDDWVPASKL